MRKILYKACLLLYCFFRWKILGNTFQGSNILFFYRNWAKHIKDSYTVGLVFDGHKLDLKEIHYNKEVAHTLYLQKRQISFHWRLKKLLSNRIRFNDSWFVFHDSSWSFHEPYFSKKCILHESYRGDRT